MLGKLLKYDLKYMIKNMSVFYLLAIFFAITTRILFSLEQTTIISIISQISVGCLFSMLASILINVIMRSWVRFRDSLYKDESYLTHTLPVEKNELYDSKFYQTLIFFVISFLIILLSLFIAYYTKDRWGNLLETIKNFTNALEINVPMFVFGILAVIFLEIFNMIQCGFLGIILGYKRDNNKIPYSVAFGFAAYQISQLSAVGLIFLIGLFNPEIMEMFKTNSMVGTDTIKTLTISAIIIYTLIIITINIVSKKKLQEGVDVE